MIELLITLGVSVIGVMGVLSLQLATLRANQGAGDSAEAVTIAKRTLEEARSKSLDEMYVDYEDATFPIVYDWDGQTVIGRTATYLRQITIEETELGSDILRMRVEVYWADEGGDINDINTRRQTSFELLRTRQEAF
jgi:Tfp pilus assembly protein PilV